MNENRIPKIYPITGLVAFTFSVILVLYAIYHQFFYVDGTWLHGFTANGFAVFSGIIWLGILLIFKRFLHQILSYRKANSLINAYVVFLGIATLANATVLYKSFKFYSSIEESVDSLPVYASSSVLSAVLILISNFAIIVICVLLGNRLRKIDIIAGNRFKLLGFSLLFYAVVSLLISLNFIESNWVQFLLLAVTSTFIGLIFKTVNETELSVLHAKTGFKKLEKPKNFDSPTSSETKREKRFKKINPIQGIKKVNQDNQTETEQEDLPNVNLDAHVDKELILSYYENLPARELNRLENLVKQKYTQELTKKQLNDLVKYYIAENKLYDHTRFMPK